MTCGQCKYYEPTRNPDTGRVLPSQPGRCEYPVVWPELPLAYRGAYLRCDGAPRFLTPGAVWPDSCASCKTFEPKKPAPKLWQESERLL